MARGDESSNTGNTQSVRMGRTVTCCGGCCIVRKYPNSWTVIRRGRTARGLRSALAMTRLIVLFMTLTTTGCMIGARNGDTFDGTNVGRVITFGGYFNKPNTTIRIQVLKDPAADPAVEANWVQIA